ncbi:TPA: hypothetical protein U1D13_000408 [Streptococcus suis]|nr:hypothetical protein [Streptococcus suis]HEM3625926.1 hypothetical protein [Streptococcus suis]HEM3639180.1 hypothetical protein [Streptococcus suis]HEM3652086.1 hypothetical protein [Streptococcus suis]HEM3656200.1 hypothetical protein [Streptococcus suis]
MAKELSLKRMLQMTYGGTFEQEHKNALFHELTDQEKFDIVVLSEITGKGTENPWATIITHAFKIGKIAGIRQERKRHHARNDH